MTSDKIRDIVQNNYTPSGDDDPDIPPNKLKLWMLLAKLIVGLIGWVTLAIMLVILWVISWH